MNRQIVSRWDSSKILYQAEAESFAALILAAIKSGANLRDANLRDANLGGANLGGANLYRANLYGADLREADLGGANLGGADLRGANLRGANLYGADLREAGLYGADLCGADLRGANLYDANLGGADLGGANLYRANLYGADLCGADLRDAKNAELAIAQASIVPDHGPLFGWKKCKNGVLVRLFIPSKAKRSNASGRKCRAERAKVLEVIGAEVGYSTRDSSFEYRTGQWVKPTNGWNDNRWEECAGGIHFFLTRIEAENYN